MDPIFIFCFKNYGLRLNRRNNPYPFCLQLNQYGLTSVDCIYKKGLWCNMLHGLIIKSFEEYEKKHLNIKIWEAKALNYKAKVVLQYLGF